MGDSVTGLSEVQVDNIYCSINIFLLANMLLKLIIDAQGKHDILPY